MTLDWILELILFSILHWILAGFVINDIARRKHVKGGHKAPWVISILFLTFVGSFVYVLFHPQILGDED